ncbi:MAG: M15 family metallopeptidase [Prevotella sp.]|jgi:hypothetical protein
MTNTIRYIAGIAMFVAAMMGSTSRAQSVQRPSKEWKAGTEVSAKMVERTGLGQWFVQQPIPDAVFARMQGKSYPAGCTIPRSSLRYLKVLHYDGDGHVRMGEMVCNRLIADDLVSIFKELYQHRYPIQSIRLIDDFDAVDERSMRANNSSCFCYRKVKGSKKLSAHARGMAVDINALYNPYYRRSRSGKVTVQPSNALKYCNRSASFPYKIDRNDLLYKLFIKHGFRWGGAWRTVKDYQHFEK